MEIATITHKALRRFVETGSSKGLDGQLIDRLRKMTVYLASIEEPDELRIPPNWGAHELTGDRGGSWSLTVTRNWRMTFRLIDGVIHDLNLEDYH